MSTDTPAPLPERIGPYQIDRILGTGGMGTVYHGVHQETGQAAAVKVLPATLATQEGFVKRFNREILALDKVSNDHIVRLLDKGVDGDTYYYAMEYVDGETLTSMLYREHRLPWRTVIDYGSQICHALKAAHDAGVIHRDLKPGNLMVTEDGTIKLADFGIAQVFAESKLTVTGGVVGTAEYMSPEQARGVRVTRKSDLYSLGAVLYVMLTGRPPFSGSATVDILHKHQYGQVERPARLLAGLPSWLDDLVLQLLEKDPDKRPPDAHVVSRRLQEIVKKVELSQGQETLAKNRDLDGGEDGFGDVGPTLMRDLVRSEIERANTQGNGLLDNTYVLIAMLGLVILGGVWWFKWRTPDPEFLFDQGVALMQKDEGSSWLEAEDKYFGRLLKLDRDKWQPRVDQYVRESEAFKARQTASPTTPEPKSNGPKSPALTEPDRLLSLAVSQRNRGELLQATNTLSALITLIQDDERYVTTYQRAAELLVQIQKDSNQTVREFITQQLRRAEQFEGENQPQQAENIRTSLKTLYGNNPAYVDMIESKKAIDEQ